MIENLGVGWTLCIFPRYFIVDICIFLCDDALRIITQDLAAGLCGEFRIFGTGLDISTISRVSNSKYVQTNFGIYPLKFFFSDGYTTEDGEEMSVREIRKILKECIDGEDKKKPLTDDELADILKEKGYPIARRTVAKYRQQLNIPVARLRK